MIFIVDNNGDNSVGIDGFTIEVHLPNPGYSDDDWIESCKSMLNEMYNDQTKGYVYTKEEWQDYLTNDFEIEERGE